LSESDIVTLHVPLNVTGENNTIHLFSEEILSKIRKRAWFINSSRGEVTDTFALKKALYSGKLAGAIIDVWENEPDIDLELMQQTLISTPHVAGYSTDGKVNGTSMVVNSLSRYFNLPLENWYPENVPLPAIPYISINCNGRSEEDILREAVIHTYKIDNDNARLRLSPGDFEKLRGDYPVRREFTSYTIDLKKGTDQIRQMLMAIGFKIKV